MMTYKELLEELRGAGEAQLNQDVTVYIGGLDEFYPVNALADAINVDEDTFCSLTIDM
jgi:hypothetical protein